MRLDFFGTLLMLLVINCGTGLAQNNAKKQESALPEPENLVLVTSDKVQLKCTYFGPTKGEQEKSKAQAVPMILLHDWGGDRSQLLNFAGFLQQAGRAVIVPDLRGHGESLEVTGFKKPLNYKRFRRNEKMSIQKDIERCKKFLVEKNNEGEVNIDLLTIVATGKIAALASQWSINDWFAFPVKNADGIKQGQDVKALILISPTKKFDKLTMADQFKNKLFTGQAVAPLPIMILWGRDEENAKDCEYVYDRLAKARPEDYSDIADRKERDAKRTRFRVPVRQPFSGVELFQEQKAKGLWAYVNKFVEDKVATKAGENPWKSRESKKEDE